MKLLAKMLAKKAFAHNPEDFKDEAEALEEAEDFFQDGEEGEIFIGVIKEWAEAKTGQTIELTPIK